MEVEGAYRQILAVCGPGRGTEWDPPPRGQADPAPRLVPGAGDFGALSFTVRNQRAVAKDEDMSRLAAKLRQQRYNQLDDMFHAKLDPDGTGTVKKLAWEERWGKQAEAAATARGKTQLSAKAGADAKAALRGELRKFDLVGDGIVSKDAFIARCGPPRGIYAVLESTQ